MTNNPYSKIEIEMDGKAQFYIFSTEHTFGHVFAITSSVSNGTFNEDICISSGFMLAEFICGQGMIVMITALSGI